MTSAARTQVGGAGGPRARGRLLFARSDILAFAGASGLPVEDLERELGPFVGVRRLADLLDVSATWIRRLHRQGALRGHLLRPPTAEGGRP